jgi:hypothetical protein
MPQPLQPLPHLQASPQPHFPEQHDIFELGWEMEALVGFLLNCLMAGLRNYGKAARPIYRRGAGVELHQEEDERCCTYARTSEKDGGERARDHSAWGGGIRIGASHSIRFLLFLLTFFFLF